MIKERQTDWQDTNLALFGSDIEKKCKEAAANGEPQWKGAGKVVGLQVWRIEQFRVVPWPKKKYGKFHRGDSYIVLNTYVKDPAVNPDKLAWDVHFWIGEESTQDEYGTAAYKTVELDDFLGGEPVQHREVQECESALFVGYFPKGVTYLKGGTETGFNHVEAEVRPVRLFIIKGRAGNILLREVKLSRNQMNSGDCFLLDTDEAVYQWNGAHSNAFEKQKAAEVAAGMRADRSVVVLSEGQNDDEKVDAASAPFWKHLPGEKRLLGIKIAEINVKEAAKGGDDEAVKAFVPRTYRMTPKGASCSFSSVGSGKLPISKLKPSRVYLHDTGFEVFVWVGKAAAKDGDAKVSAFPFAQHYLKVYKRPPVLPIARVNQGKETAAFNACFGPPVKESCCVIS